MMKVLFWYFVRDTHKVMIALTIVASAFVWLPYIFFVELLSSLKLMLLVMDAAAHFSMVHKKKIWQIWAVTGWRTRENCQKSGQNCFSQDWECGWRYSGATDARSDHYGHGICQSCTGPGSFWSCSWFEAVYQGTSKICWGCQCWYWTSTWVSA